ncbi:MAG: hypothetical protein KJ990_02465 [Proteobacteria bacterium]|nr:hypothetical protein [Pseudomonadota bacterium]MBU1648830.1 hypothetical protein [Pseudomonadota bacterium]MBU1986713.1 hypothetical protein [Pseudomonadota bacterium]
MAGTPRKKVQKIKFELTRSAIAGVGVVCFCIFLWMFLLGVWTGESLLRPSHSGKNEVSKIVTPKKTN